MKNILNIILTTLVFFCVVLCGCSPNSTSTPKLTITTTDLMQTLPSSVITPSNTNVPNSNSIAPSIEIYLDSSCTVPWNSNYLPTPQSISPNTSTLTVYLKNVGTVSADVSVTGWTVLASSGLVEVNAGDCKPITIVVSSAFSDQSSVSFQITSTTFTSTPSLTSISISPASPINLTLDDEVQFTAMGSYSDGATANITFQVNWLSSDPKIINIVPDDIGFTGKATAESPGIIHITASMNGITSQVVNVKSVEPVSLVSIAISPSLPTNLVQCSFSSELTAFRGKFSS